MSQHVVANLCFGTLKPKKSFRNKTRYSKHPRIFIIALPKKAKIYIYIYIYYIGYIYIYIHGASDLFVVFRLIWLLLSRHQILGPVELNHGAEGYKGIEWSPISVYGSGTNGERKEGMEEGSTW